MAPKTSVTSKLNQGLRIFFSEFVRVSLRHPSQALFFARTLLWQGLAARRRARMARERIHVPPIAIFSITNGCNLPCEGSPSSANLTMRRFVSHYVLPMDSKNPLESAQPRIREAASLIRGSRYLTAFTGAGISAESGIPPFRGPGGLWSRYDPRMLELDFFLAHPDQAWPVIREIFYDNFGTARPNRAHEVLSAWEARGLLKCLITQNIDSVQ